jgi:hypothetical protein
MEANPVMEVSIPVRVVSIPVRVREAALPVREAVRLAAKPERGAAMAVRMTVRIATIPVRVAATEATRPLLPRLPMHGKLPWRCPNRVEGG